ncbi:MAG: hypothetical protein L6W00_12040 [Lentisphaeria bacterium]|nr:MAG: hypothetical protein L6W00_12040 [Lentisphaeria bacterium]
MPNLTQTKIDELIEKLNFYKYLVSVGETVLGPLKSAPKIEADVETKDIKLYETGTEPQASILVKNNVKLTLELEDIDAAMSKMEAFKKGDNVLDSTKSEAITLVPITDDEGAKTITFPNAFLQPGLAMTLGEDDDANSTTLTYLCRPDATTGKTFTYAA